MFQRSKALVAFALLLATIGAAPPPPQPAVPGGNGEPAGPPPPPVYQPMSAPSPTATVDPGVLHAAKTWFAELQSGTVNRSQLAPKMSGSLTDADLAKAKDMIGSLGPPASFVQQQSGSQGGISYAIYLVTFKNGTKYNFFFAIDQQGKVEGLQLGRPQ
jgi:hypothetical protein